MCPADSASDEALIRDLAVRYAHAVDQNEPALLEALFEPEGVIEGPGFRMQGLEEIRRIPAMLKSIYSITWHVLHQQLVTVSGDEANSETHAIANHLTETGDGKATNLVWHIRYRDRLRRTGGTWRFAHRLVTLDWAETRAVSMARN